MLDKLGIQYKRTDVSGTIVVGSDGEHIYVSTEKQLWMSFFVVDRVENNIAGFRVPRR